MSNRFDDKGSIPMGCRFATACSVVAGSLCLGVSPSLAEDLFSNQTIAQGVQFRHHLSISNDLIFVGAGAAWGDFDDDGDMDLYVADQNGPNRLFMNLGGGTGFEDVADDYGVANPDSSGNGALWGDYDNDGDTDLYVLNRGENILFRNDGADGSGGWMFTDVTEITGAGGGIRRTTAAIYGDYDNDGWLDLYVVNHSYPPDVYPETADPDHADRFFHNVEGAGGERVFVDVGPDLLGLDVLEHSVGHSAGFFDFDNDHDLDLYVLNEDWDADLLSTILWRNDGPDGAGGWLFTNVTESCGVGLYEAPMGLAISDYNNDGWLDLATSDIGPNHLFRNLGGVFIDDAMPAGVDRELLPNCQLQYGWGTVFLDYDLDGFEDLFVATGRLPAQEQPNPLFHNLGNVPENSFEEMTEISGCADPGAARTVVKADYDGDGDQDLYVVNYDGYAQLCRNEQQNGDYLVLKLLGEGSNRDAVGTRVRLIVDGRPDQYRMVQSGSTTGGGHELALYFGVTGAEVIDQITIDWPSGLQTVLTDVEVNQRLTVNEPPLPPPAPPEDEEPVSDGVAPTLGITEPAGSTQVTTAESTIIVRGWASDDSGIKSVSWENSRGGNGPCQGTMEWSSGPIALQEGDNVITITVMDEWENSTSASVAVARIVIDPVVEPPVPPEMVPDPPGDDPSDDPGTEPGVIDVDDGDPDGPVVDDEDPDDGGQPAADPTSDGDDVEADSPASRDSVGSSGACGVVGLAPLLSAVLGLMSARFGPGRRSFRRWVCQVLAK